MRNKNFLLCFFVAFICWLMPFISSFFLDEYREFPVNEIETMNLTEESVVNTVIEALRKNDNKSAFVIIFQNNLKNCILNILGGVMLGIGTFINIIFNGFVTGNVFDSYYNIEQNIDIILKTTLPHSFELIGFWLSGAIGFYIAWLIICFMRGKENFTPKACIRIGIYSGIVFLIILSAAYVEAFITSKQL